MDRYIEMLLTAAEAIGMKTITIPSKCLLDRDLVDIAKAGYTINTQLKFYEIILKPRGSK